MAQKYKVYINNKLQIIDENWKSFCSEYKMIDAAGGIVYNNDKILLIFRNRKWDLPKGKVEKGESVEMAAIREVKEECGVDDLEITARLQVTFHAYVVEGQNILKRTYWYRMHSNFKGNLVPQKIEGIEKVEWVSKDDLFKKLDSMFGNIKDLLFNELF